jgi:hypothetical protein
LLEDTWLRRQTHSVQQPTPGPATCSVIETPNEDIPWKWRRLVVGTGADGGLPVMKDVKREAEERRIKLLALPFAQTIEMLNEDFDDTNAVLHVTC